MEIKTLQALYGLKWNPFATDKPLEGLQVLPKLERFCYRVEDLVLEGGYAAVMGEPGLGKSTLLRLLQERIAKVPNVVVGELSRSQCSVNDFYRELADLFGVFIQVSNRYCGHKTLRKKWQGHIDTTLLRPVLLIDEAQRINDAVFEEIKSLASDRLDTKMLITVIFAGDMRLAERLNSQTLKPIDSRLRYKLVLTAMENGELTAFLQNCLRLAGAPSLMTPELVGTLVDRSLGNFRTLMTLCNDCLVEAVRMEAQTIDEKLFFDLTGDQFIGSRRPSAKLKRAAP
jgi:type II secretory pathway predicted ATPase ExeA